MENYKGGRKLKYVFSTLISVENDNPENWIPDSKLISPRRIEAEGIEDALEKFRCIINSGFGIFVSKEDLFQREPVYGNSGKIESGQIGYSFSGILNSKIHIKIRVITIVSSCEL